MATTASKTFMSYIAREKCGCVTGVTLDTPENRKAAAKDVAGWIKDGRVIERVDSGYVRTHFAECPKGIIGHYDRHYCRKCEHNALQT